jgi:hypothetical protein
VRQLRRHERCLNCGEPVPGNFCGRCGQENTDYHVSLRQLLGDAADELLQLESRLWRSLWDLVRRPGRLTNAYVAGQRVRYTTPLRLYLLAVGAYFALGSLLPQPAGHRTIVIGDSATTAPSSAFEARLRERLGIVDGKIDPDAINRRAHAALMSTMPKVLALLVPGFALLTMALFRRPRRFFVEHLVLALHVHALAFLLFLLVLPPRLDDMLLIALAAATLWTVLALRAVFAQSWPRTLVKAAVLGLLYSILVGAGVTTGLLLGIWYS